MAWLKVMVLNSIPAEVHEFLGELFGETSTGADEKATVLFLDDDSSSGVKDGVAGLFGKTQLHYFGSGRV